METSMREMFRTDEKSEREGIWLNFGHFMVRVARAGGANKKFQKALEEMSREHRRAIDLEIMDNELAEDILRQVYAKTVVTGWKTKVGEDLKPGIEGPEGTLIPFNEKNVLATFRELPDLFESVKEDAGRHKLFRAKLREEAAKNS